MEHHDLQEAVKNEILLTSSSHFRGYQPLGANVTRYEGGFQRDWHEAIDLYREEPVAYPAHCWVFMCGGLYHDSILENLHLL